MATKLKKDPARNAYLKSLNKPGSSNYVSKGAEVEGAGGGSRQSNKTVQLPNGTPQAGLSTIPGPYDAATGKLKTGANLDSSLQQMADQNPEAADLAMDKLGYTNSPNADTVGFDAKTGAPLAPGATTTDALGNTFTQGQKFKDAFAAQNATGMQAPVTQGAANPFMPAPENQEDNSIIDMAVQEAMQPITDLYVDYFSPENQRKSLFEMAKPYMKELDNLDEEIIDAKTIIEGTEDDIRNEIEMAGGFGTDSQVQALALGRNKVLLKNYNNLVAMRESKATQMDTMMDWADKDRTYADKQFDKMIDYQTQMVEFRDKFIQNARDQYNKYTPQQLNAMLAGNPRQLAFAEQILGVGEGGIAKLASAPLSEEAQLDLDYKKEQILNMKAQRANIYSDIAARNADNTVMVDQNGKVLLPQKESMKINKEIANTDAFKAITKGKDSLQFLNEFESLFKETGATSAVWSPRENSKLKTKYNTAILNLKEFFNLGVLNGPDEAILRGVLPDPTNRSATLNVASLGIYNPATATRSGIENMKKMIESSLDERYKSLTSQYGDYSAQSVGAVRDLNRIYVDQKSKVNPEVQKLIQENPDLTEDDIIMILSE